MVRLFNRKIIWTHQYLSGFESGRKGKHELYYRNISVYNVQLRKEKENNVCNYPVFYGISATDILSLKHDWKKKG